MTLPQPIPFFSAMAGFAAGSDTPRAFLERCLDRLAEFEPAVGAFVCHDIAAARIAADNSTARWRDGRPLSPIDGMPLGIKDIIETADMPTEQGSPLFAGWRTGRDAASVAALREAGAVILGKVVTTEFAATEPRGTRNPWEPSAPRADRAAAPPPRSPAAWSLRRSGPRSSARSCVRRVFAASSASSRASAGSIAAAATIISARAAPACSPPRSKTLGLSRSISRRGPAAIRAIPGCKDRPNRRRHSARALSPYCKRPDGRLPRPRPGAFSKERRHGWPKPELRSPTVMPIPS